MFRDCNGESNGEELPAETVLAERICSGEVIEEEPPSPGPPLPHYVRNKSSRTGKSEGKFKSRVSGASGGVGDGDGAGGNGAGDGAGEGNGEGDGRGSGKGRRGPVGGTGGVGGNGPAGPDGNCAWNGPGACAREGKTGGVGGVGGVGGIGQVGWAGPKPNCAWDGPGGCKGKKKKNRRKNKNKGSNENFEQFTTIIKKSENISALRVEDTMERNSSNLEEFHYDYSEDELSYDTEYGFNYDYIAEDSENKIEKRRIEAANDYRYNPDHLEEKLEKEKSRYESDLASVQQWLKQG